jgi:YHS domain-containing protein
VADKQRETMFTLAMRVFVVVMTLLIVVRLLRRLFDARRLHVPPAQPKGVRSATVKDPVCGMYLDPKVAVRMDHKNGVFFFCSDACKQKFALEGLRPRAENGAQESPGRGVSAK